MNKRRDLLSCARQMIDDREVLQLSRELIKIPSVTTHEERISKFIFQRLDKWGLSPKLVPVKGFGRSVFAEIGDRKAPSIVLNGHIDTVEVMSGWKHDPFGAKVENGMLYGLGSLDMKGGIAALMIAFRSIAEMANQHSSRIVLQAVTGEETTCAGTRAMISRGGFRKARAVIVGEGFGGLRAISNGRRGGSYFNIEVTGKAAHGSKPEDGINAIADAAKIVCAIDAMKLKIVNGLVADDFQTLNESQTVLKISGGSQTLTVPEKCSLKLVRCTVPGSGNVEAELSGVIKNLNLKSRVRIELETTPGDLLHPYMTAPTSPLVKAAAKSIKALTGKQPMLVIGRSEADDNIIAHDAKVPVICFGPGESGDLAKYHQPEEAVSIPQLALASRAYFMTVLEMAQSG
ncbi:MAG: ArgE/DapE family deacylase [Candidatus Thermoplasmatota archaeon]|nr:ArgE/DapE family deacylase [Candidatus Thermoplasmatota archaeon]